MGMEPYIGEIILFAGGYAPQGWGICDGSILQISQNQALYSLLGNTYGGDGTTTFALPDLRGRVPIGIGQRVGTSFYARGNQGGYEKVQLNVNNLPVHSHSAKITEANVATAITIKASSANGTETSPEGAVPAIVNTPAAVGPATLQKGYTKNDPNVDMKATPVNIKLENVEVTVDYNGGGQPVENRQPYLAMNYIIALEGLYPPRP